MVKIPRSSMNSERRASEESISSRTGRGLSIHRKSVVSPLAKQTYAWGNVWYEGLNSRKGDQEMQLRKMSEAGSEPQTKAPPSHHFFIHQENPYMVGWSLFILLLVVYTTISTPYMIAVQVNQKVKPDGMFVFDRCLDGLFILDVVLQFFVTYEDPISMVEVTNLRRIAKHYLEFWFWIDMAAVFPYDLVSFLMEDEAVSNLSTLSIIRMFRMLKLFKLVSIKRYFAKMEADYAINYDYLELLKYLVAVFFIVHLLACGLMIIGKEEFDAPEDDVESWLVANDLVNSSNRHRYLTAAYWATMTLSTIGYGDIDLVTPAEQAYAIFAMILGASIYAYVVGSICNIILNINKDSQEYKNNLSSLNSFMEDIMLPRTIQRLIRQFYAHTYEFRKSAQNKEILQVLSPQLQALVGAHMNGVWVSSVPIFGNLDGATVAQLSLSLEPHSFSPGESLIKQGEPITDLVILCKGTIAEFVFCFTVPYHFGVEIILSHPGRYHVQRFALRYCDTYFLSRKRLWALLKRHPLANVEIRKQAIKLTFCRTMREIKRQYLDGEIDRIMDYKTQHISWRGISPRSTIRTTQRSVTKTSFPGQSSFSERRKSLLHSPRHSIGHHISQMRVTRDLAGDEHIGHIEEDNQKEQRERLDTLEKKMDMVLELLSQTVKVQDLDINQKKRSAKLRASKNTS